MTGLEIALGVALAALVTAAVAGHSSWTWPVRVRARLTSRFGPRDLNRDGHPEHHAGVDIGVPTGTTVYPIGPGQVVVARTFSPEEVGTKSSGNYVAIDHPGGKRSLYMHLSKVLVKAGDQVGPAQPLGLSGATGRGGPQMGPHLHLELQIRQSDGRYRNVDPLNYVLPI